MKCSIQLNFPSLNRTSIQLNFASLNRTITSFTSWNICTIALKNILCTILDVFSLLQNNKQKSNQPKSSHTFHTTAMHDEQPFDHDGIKITDPNSALVLTDSYGKDGKTVLKEQSHSHDVTVSWSVNDGSCNR